MNFKKKMGFLKFNGFLKFKLNFEIFSYLKTFFLINSMNKPLQNLIYTKLDAKKWQNTISGIHFLFIINEIV